MSKYIEDHAVSMNHQLFPETVETLRTLVDDDCAEGKLQAHLQAHPYILSEQFAHCHYVFPQVRFGDRLVADFLCLETPSYGNEWIGIEIEPANMQVVTKSGRKSAKLEHALQQVRDWRRWVQDNIDTARRRRDHNGLGLEDINPRFTAEVIIGRRRDHTDAYDKLRRQVRSDELIAIRSWDSVIDRAEKRAKTFSDFAKKLQTGTLW